MKKKQQKQSKQKLLDSMPAVHHIHVRLGGETYTIYHRDSCMAYRHLIQCVEDIMNQHLEDKKC